MFVHTGLNFSLFGGGPTPPCVTRSPDPRTPYCLCFCAHGHRNEGIQGVRGTGLCGTLGGGGGPTLPRVIGVVLLPRSFQENREIPIFSKIGHSHRSGTVFQEDILGPGPSSHKICFGQEITFLRSVFKALLSAFFENGLQNWKQWFSFINNWTQIFGVPGLSKNASMRVFVSFFACICMRKISVYVLRTENVCTNVSTQTPRTSVTNSG